jgi:hypothetical protein
MATKTKAPTAIVVAGERWPIHVLHVIGWDEDGNPREFRIVRDDEKATLTGGEDPTKNTFFVIYGPPGMTPPRKN